VLLRARVVGGLKIIDRGVADDKIIAVLEGDYLWGGAHELTDLPGALLERIEHYFSTYKLVPDQPPNIALTGRYGYTQAAAVIDAAIADYREMFPRSTSGA
jgi:inorganic pyrophosphatase